MKEFYLPGYYNHYQLFYLLDQYMKTHLDYFIKDRIIAGAYDLPNGLLWNGGRAQYHDQPYNKDQTNKIMNYFFIKSNFKLLHTCTNKLITEYECNDINCNNFIEKYYRKQDKIIVASLILKNYLQTKYPNISFVNSTTLGIIDINKVNELTEKEIYVPYYTKSIDNNYLKQLKHPENIEILIAESCMPDCPKRAEHYHAADLAMHGITMSLDTFICPFAEKIKGPITQRIIEYPHMVSNIRIEELADMGITKFKISGRLLSPIEWFEVIVYYLVKLEYQYLVFSELVQTWIQLIQNIYIKNNKNSII